MGKIESKIIRGYRDYIIQSDGRIYSLAVRRFLKQQFNLKGYKRVQLYRKGQRQWFFIHRLVASAFIGSVARKEVHHVDCNKLNNNLSNLRILSPHQHQAEHIAYQEIKCPF